MHFLVGLYCCFQLIIHINHRAVKHSEVIFEKASLGLACALLTYKRMGRERPLHSKAIFFKHGELENYKKCSFGLLCSVFTHLKRFLKYSNSLCIMESICNFAEHVYGPDVFSLMWRGTVLNS
jgi:hypothetical protein